MRKGIRRLVALTATGVLAMTGTVACSDEPATKTAKIGVILPDSESAVRWETADRKYLKEAFDRAGVLYDIQNANNDPARFQAIADQMIADGVTVLMIVNLDSGSGKAVLDKAKAAGIGTIDYDRLTLNGGADYYVSFDNVAVGKLQGDGLVKCLTDAGKTTGVKIAELNGSPTDNNATLFKQGYDSVLDPKYASGWTKVGDQFVPGWSGEEADRIFTGIFQTAGGQIDGVLAANDTLGNAAITVLKRNGLNGTVPVTGQDASLQGLQNILAGDQCMTVYKAIKQEADAAAELALALARNETVTGLGSVTDTETNREVPSKLLVPQAIFKDNVKDVVNDGFVDKGQLCAGEFAALCAEVGIA